MLAEPGAIGSISAQSTVIAGDCQSPKVCFAMSS